MVLGCAANRLSRPLRVLCRKQKRGGIGLVNADVRKEPQNVEQGMSNDEVQ